MVTGNHMQSHSHTYLVFLLAVSWKMLGQESCGLFPQGKWILEDSLKTRNGGRRNLEAWTERCFQSWCIQAKRWEFPVFQIKAQEFMDSYGNGSSDCCHCVHFRLCPILIKSVTVTHSITKFSSPRRLCNAKSLNHTLSLPLICFSVIHHHS